MSTANWISLAGGLVALAAFGLSLLTLRRQGRKDKSDAEKDLSERISAIELELAKLGPSSPSGPSTDMIATTSNVNAALQALVLRVAALIDSAHLAPDWFQTAVLAMAFLEIGDMPGADRYTDSAVTLARKGPESRKADEADRSKAAEVMSLGMRATFFFNRGLDGDADLGRQSFDAAREIVEKSQDHQGPYFSRGRMIELYVRQAAFELGMGERENVTRLVASAIKEWAKLTAPDPKRTCGMILIDFAQRQLIARPEELLPTDFQMEMDRLRWNRYGPPPSAVPPLAPFAERPTSAAPNPD